MHEESRLTFESLRIFGRAAVLALSLLLFAGCSSAGREHHRRGDEIMVCGRLFHTGAPVVLWTDSGGYDAYRTEKRFVPWERASWAPPTAEKKSEGPSTPARYGIRFASSVGQPDCPLSPEDFERIRGGGWDLPTLQRCVDQFVLHYDVCGTSRQCFRVLHDVRGLSVHFMLDIDGTIYQTLDLKERAWHATTSNDRSIGIEIANIGAYSEADRDPLSRWYEPDPPPFGLTENNGDPMREPPARYYSITLPPELGDGGVRNPARVGPTTLVYGTIQGRLLRMMDLTPQQYRSLERLTAALCRVFPNLPPDYPRDAEGRLITTRLPDAHLREFRGVLGHFHIQENKVDPGPALDWERVIDGARR